MDDGNAILNELTEIQRTHGGLLDPHDVVEYAKNKKTALHSRFDWNDTEAAAKWRLEQARRLIRVMVTVVEDFPKECRAFVSLKKDQRNGGGYRAVISILKDDKLRGQLMEDVLSDMIAFQKKYKQIKELVGVFKEMDRTMVKLMTKPILRKQSQPARVAVTA